MCETGSLQALLPLAPPMARTWNVWTVPGVRSAISILRLSRDGDGFGRGAAGTHLGLIRMGIGHGRGTHDEDGGRSVGEGDDMRHVQGVCERLVLTGRGLPQSGTLRRFRALAAGRQMSEDHSQMNGLPSPAPPGRVASLHLHPNRSGEAFQGVEAVELVAEKGILGNGRYFGRISSSSGKSSRRQVSLIEREQIAEHAAALGLEGIPPGAVRANVETEGMNLVALVGRKIQVGSAVLLLYEARVPCPNPDISRSH